MEYRRLGQSGLQVSELCLGTMMFGAQTDEKTAARIVGLARDAGVNFIDTADRYAIGRSETIVGKLLKRDRDDWVLATKVCGPMGDGPNQRGLGRKWLIQELGQSLRRLGTDYVDLYYLHFRDEGTPIEETIGTLGDLIRDGQVRYWGVSNFNGWEIAEAALVADRLGVPRPVAVQPLYNAMNRMAEVEILPACQRYGIGVVPYSPLARGVLSGKYRPDRAPPKGTRAGRADPRMMQTEWRPESLALAQHIAQYGTRRGADTAALAVRWVLNNQLVSSVIGGPRTVAQWRSYVQSSATAFTDADETFFDSLVPAGHPSTPGYTDPARPVTGRVPRTRRHQEHSQT